MAVELEAFGYAKPARSGRRRPNQVVVIKKRSVLAGLMCRLRMTRQFKHTGDRLTAFLLPPALISMDLHDERTNGWFDRCPFCSVRPELVLGAALDYSRGPLFLSTTTRRATRSSHLDRVQEDSATHAADMTVRPVTFGGMGSPI